MSICRRCVVSGQVQGVWFRAATQEKARQLDLRGWVRNLADGGVEVFACGDKPRVEELCQWLELGPPRARVTEVRCETAPSEQHEGFSLRH